MQIKDYQPKFFTRDNEALNCYYNDIKKYEVLSKEEEEKLFYQYKHNGDEKAREKLILCNQRFIVSIAKILTSDSNKLLDLVNEGNIGLIKALDKYDASVGTRFLSFAVWYIRREMNYYVNDTGGNMINHTYNLKLGRKISKIKQDYMVRTGEYPSDEYIRKVLLEDYNIDVKNVDIYDINIESINEVVDDEDFTREEESEFTIRTSSTNDYEETISNDYYTGEVNELLKCVSERDQDVMKMYYGVGYDREYSKLEIAAKYNITELRVGNIINRAKAVMGNKRKAI